MNCLLIDHNDSFTCNIVAWLSSAGIKTTTLSYSTLVKTDLLGYDFVLLSAGPGAPSDYPKTLRLIDKTIGTIPIFGVCLGMQLLLTNYGKKISNIKNPQHGKVSNIHIIRENKLFKNLGKNINVARYHSLGFKYKKQKFVTATCDNLIMAIEDNKNKIAGTQFHSESFLTKDANILAKNLKSWIKTL